MLRKTKLSCVAMTMLATSMFVAGSASAQHTTCMAMGHDMMTCDTIGSSAPQGDGGAALGSGIGALIAKGRERSFNKKVGTLLANGDCEGAGRFALEKGRLELGTKILADCRAKREPKQTSTTTDAITPNNLASAIQLTASRFKTPVTMEDGAVVTEVRGIGSQLLITAALKPGQETVSDAELTKMRNDTCATEFTQAIVRAGGSVRLVFNNSLGKQVAAIMTTARDCGV